MTVDDLDEYSAERPRLPQAVMDQSSRPGPEPTTLEAVVVVVQAGDDDDDVFVNGHVCWCFQ